MNYLKNIESDSLKPFIISAGVLLIFLSFIVPFPAILFIQDFLFFSYDHLAFIRPSTAYFGFGAGMVTTAIVLFSFLFTKIYSEKKETDYKLTGLHLLLLLFSFSIFAFSISHYYYLDEYGVHSNTFWTFSEKSIAWENVDEVSRLAHEEDYRILSYTFSNTDNSITVPYNSDDEETSNAIYGVIDEYDWDVVEYFTDE